MGTSGVGQNKIFVYACIANKEIYITRLLIVECFYVSTLPVTTVVFRNSRSAVVIDKTEILSDSQLIDRLTSIFCPDAPVPTLLV